MGTNTLTTRVSGDTITTSFFNDFNTALEGDFVGRNSAGIPTSNQNIGTVALPWGTCRITNLIVNGATIDTTKILAPVNRVVSGQVRTTSNQAQFIWPKGSNNSFDLKATTTNLVLDINGVSVSFVADQNKASLTLAPSSQNTALVNNILAIGQWDTRLWGEEWCFKTIAMDTAGTGITALIGKWASFKIVHGGNTEYFLAFVNSATELTKCLRGYFYNSAGAPINRIAIYDNDVITLMSTAWIFATNDGSTLDVTYNNPIWNYVAPTGPATGDYWYDLANNLWKRYDGASWISINRVFIGMAIIDTANCVGARSVDFYRTADNQNTVDLEISTTEIIKATKLNQNVSIYGNLLEFKNTLASWNITTQLATSTEMYNATEQASTVYWLYISDIGQCIISDITPYYRGDLKGWYHPHNTWRAVGLAYNNASNNFIQAGGIETNKTDICYDSPGTFPATDTKIRYFTTAIRLLGASFIGTTDASVSGTVLTCFIPCTANAVYSGESYTGAGFFFGFSLNSANRTTNIQSLPGQSNEGICVGYCLSTEYGFVSASINAKMGDILRPHTAGGVSASAWNCQLKLISSGCTY